jgi:hypothetical protein
MVQGAHLLAALADSERFYKVELFFLKLIACMHADDFVRKPYDLSLSSRVSHIHIY